MRLGRLIVLIAVLALFGGFSARAATSPVVVATIAQIGQPLSEIAGECANVGSLLGEGVDPQETRMLVTAHDAFAYFGRLIQALIEGAAAAGHSVPA